MPSTPQVPTSQLPRTSGGFVLVKELGRGGMGIVYQAQELSSGRQVALKVLAKELVVSPEAFERFRREARLAASISDSRCVFVYGAHEIEGAPAISMELCGGETLEHRIKSKEPIPIASAVQWTLEILEGLEAAQRSGIVHRDVKPSNCFISEEGRVKVGDFGLSRSLDNDVGLTQSGVFLGSPLYASPEQIKGRAVDLRSDIYSTGATLYAMLTGQPPYTGQNIGEVLARILSEPPPAPRSIRREIPRGLEKVVLRAMERDPEKRYRDHVSFREALAPFAVRSHAPGGLRRRTVAYLIDSQVTGLLSGLTLLLLGLLGWKPQDLLVEAERMSGQTAWSMIITELVWIAYFVLLEGRFGQTLGKWLLGLRVVSSADDQPSFPRAAARAALFFAPLEVLYFAPYLVEMSKTTYGIMNAAGTPLLALAAFAFAREANGKRALHDLASGMRVVRLPTPFARFRRAQPPPSAELARPHGIPERIGSYAIEGAVGDTPRGTLLQAHDPGLGRSVWIYPRVHATHAPDEARRMLVRAGRLRWLDSVREGDAHYDVYESPGGIGLSTYAQQHDGMEWPLAYRCLNALAAEAGTRELAGGACLEQLWIDRSWNLRVVDEPIGVQACARLAPLELASNAAQRMLPRMRRQRALLPPDLPAHAEPAVRRLFGLDPPFADVGELHKALDELGNRPHSLGTRARATQMSVSGAPILLALILVSLLGIAAGTWMLPTVRAAQYVEHISQARDPQAKPSELLDADGLKARQILIAEAHENRRATDVIELGDDELEIEQEALALYPEPTAEELAWAREALAREDKPIEDGSFVGQILQAVPMVACSSALVWGVLASLSAMILRGGIGFSIVGIRVRTQRGVLASRWRCLLRSFAVWMPLVAMLAVPAWLAKQDMLTEAYVVLGVALLVLGAAIAQALWDPTRSIADRIVGTRLVPR